MVEAGAPRQTPSRAGRAQVSQVALPDSAPRREAHKRSQDASVVAPPRSQQPHGGGDSQPG